MSTAENIDELYEQRIRLLPRTARLRLLERIRRELEEETATPVAKRSALDILAEAPGHRLFKTAEEVDAFLAEERSSWE
jgi:predicted GTPase